MRPLILAPAKLLLAAADKYAMARPLRDSDPGIFRLVTIRTEHARLWMLPTRNLEKILGAIVARYQEILGVEIYAYCFLGNHLHIIIRAPRANADEFFENVNREIARRVNRKNNRHGAFWGSRYRDLEILSSDDLLEAFLYVTTNAVKHGLVKHPSEWTGLCSYRQTLSERDHAYTFYLHSADRAEDRVSRHSIRLSILPDFSQLSKADRQAKLHQLIEERVTTLVDIRQAEGKGFLGIEGALACELGAIPREVAQSPQPGAYSKNPELIKNDKAERRLRRDAYDEASARYRLGDLSVEFPVHSYKPPLHRKPRLAPFEPLPQDHFKNAA